MQKITIHNFGPIHFFESEINDLNIVIGPQASGKSTISKLVHFFKSIPVWIKQYSPTSKTPSKNNYENFIKDTKSKFLDLFGPTMHMGGFKIEYMYDIDKTVVIYWKQGFVQITFNKALRTGISTTLDSISKFIKNRESEKNSYVSIHKVSAPDIDSSVFYDRINHEIELLFNDSRTPIFIPAGRSLITTLSEQLDSFDPKLTDFIMRDYISYIKTIRPFFREDFKAIVNNVKKLSHISVDEERTNSAISIIEKILRGKYVYDATGEKIFYDEKHYTKLSLASSGQQESIWILLLIFILILERADVFIVIEEPEAHLYPEAQKSVVDLIGILHTTGKNQIFITTHSPYILASANNLFYASTLGKTKKDQVSSIVPRHMWMNINKTSAFHISNGDVEDIIDRDLKMIKTEAIDSASDVINSQYDELFSLDEM